MEYKKAGKYKVGMLLFPGILKVHVQNDVINPINVTSDGTLNEYWKTSEEKNCHLSINEQGVQIQFLGMLKKYTK